MFSTFGGVIEALGDVMLSVQLSICHVASVYLAGTQHQQHERAHCLSDYIVMVRCSRRSLAGHGRLLNVSRTANGLPIYRCSVNNGRRA